LLYLIVALQLSHQQRNGENIMYAVTNAFEIRESLKAMGAKWDGAKRAWIITQAMLDKCNARTQAYGMAWCKGWAKASVAAV
jgi:hypothetical protein